MASIGTDDEGLKFTLSVLSQLPSQGFVMDRGVMMNSELGVVKLLFKQTLDDKIWLDLEIMVFTDSLLSWIVSIENMITTKSGHQVVGFDNMACPHLLLNAQKHEWTTSYEFNGEVIENHHLRYELFAGLASMYLLKLGGSWNEGLGMWLEPDAQSLLAFVHELRQELNSLIMN